MSRFESNGGYGGVGYGDGVYARLINLQLVGYESVGVLIDKAGAGGSPSLVARGFSTHSSGIGEQLHIQMKVDDESVFVIVVRIEMSNGCKRYSNDHVWTSGIEDKQPNYAIRKCARVQLIKNGKKIASCVPNDGCLNYTEENEALVLEKGTQMYSHMDS
ncbi:hypothetical protein L1987_85256 [Smallanthus sonchifolius]|uniref:Uncharacterized protein n=3 Tax=Smallanthus sonchifolius TaxID=185202 RepID=A0ACB8XW13_9ASTR|nr:hypothetical protein L1987_85252 [Smallanthus sonchifolius]KAI3675662.1 hypothetical protein L1987_85254 [Smallanthus sonchifolius]KAI3675664.1 hypothetical protein L1987_85256 [Smallanthus sonchifolius]